jgi:hypothetical protein
VPATSPIPSARFDERPGLKAAVDAGSDVAARLSIQIVAGEATRDGYLRRPHVEAEEPATAGGVIFFIPEQATFHASGEPRPQAVAGPRKTRIFLEGRRRRGSCARKDRANSRLEAAIRPRSLHGIVGIVGRDVLVLAFDAGEDPEGGRTCAELITDQAVGYLLFSTCSML